MNLLVLKDNSSKIDTYYDELKFVLKKKSQNGNVVNVILGNLNEKIDFSIDYVVVITEDIYKYSKILEMYKSINIPIYIVLSTIKSNIVSRSVNITHFVYHIGKGPKYLVERIFLKYDKEK